MEEEYFILANYLSDNDDMEDVIIFSKVIDFYLSYVL